MFLSQFTTPDDAKKIITDSLKTSAVEEIPLEKAYQRVIAQEVISTLNSPPFDRSAMDGYAILAEDSFSHSEANPFHLKVVDRIGAGEKSNLKLKSGEAIKIATGAPIPAGANAVVMEEYTHEEDDTLEVLTSVVPGENVSPAGEDFNKGDLVLKKGKLLGPAELAIIASAGFSKVKIFKKPKIAVLITGSELVMPKNILEGAEVINSNHFTIKSMVESCLAIPKVLHSIDSAELVEEIFEKLLDEYDALITTGGTAISKGDVVVDVAEKLGDVPIHGVSLRPGKPFGFAQIHGKPVFMLSGFPVAAMVQFDVFVRQALFKMQGLTFKPLLVQKKATRKIPSTLGRIDYIRAKIEGQMVRPLKIKGSGIIKSMVESDSYIIIPENLEGIEKGAECEVLPYHSLKA
ncbi:gephyrin-like molybdotransferase Glp [Methanobacterium subterraneum]|uniref:Molybdopterin molybdotransferase MoeA n=1 Tax=Methanobacterium subterraneum TaxID=59277 RepID=A0A7K4DLT0_9EURY|nr:gephyrin-like molybdotransferase Glp [Methanobacterium subterraneum]MBW4256263.1 molybdopterin molybdotransferase MoeA [Methanobacterium sp. YSL]NMO09433.1 molybdopterin molybdotransferase MoeA [Methanobacterium subterraneum]PKL74082.1 MAG: molybdopterin molybdenumtransferase MoeA [Methanobacteriales archaeon HGW-Methanobacteriales-2]